MTAALISQAEARKLLGVGEKMFPTLGIPFIAVGKRRKYHPDDIQEWINRNREEAACPSVKGKARRSTGMTSPSKVLGFEEARKQLTRHSLPQ